MKLTKTIFGAGCALAVVAQPAAAQSLSDWSNAGGSEMRAVASFTIPLGGSRKVGQTEPRLDFALQSYRIGPDRASHWQIDSAHNKRRLQRQSVVSFTLNRQPKLLLNGRKVVAFGPTLHADDDGEKGGGGNTALLVIGGLGVAVLGAAVATTADAVDAVNDLTDPD